MPCRESLITELLEDTARARRRRLHITAAMDFRLLALQTVDDKIDRNLRALSVFGQDAIQAAEQAIAASDHAPTTDALIHVAAACAVQAATPQADDEMLVRWFERFGATHRTALRDAWWFYPLDRASAARHPARVDALLRSTHEPACSLGVELAGRCGMQTCLPLIVPIAATANEGQLLRASELALCRLGQPPDDLAARIQRRGSGTAEDLLHALRLIAASGRLDLAQAEGYLRCASMPHPALQRLGWCLATLCDPVQAHQQADERAAMAPDLRLQVLALAGFPQTLIAVAREVTAQPGPATAPQMDALTVLLGNVPMQVRTTDVSPEEREKALRLRVLQVFRDAHIAVTNEAKTCAWEAGLMLAEPDPAHHRRLRFGRAVRSQEAGGVALLPPVQQLGSLMRQALYIEQSVQAHRPVGASLSAYASTRHQMHVIGLSEWLGEAHAEAR